MDTFSDESPWTNRLEVYVTFVLEPSVFDANKLENCEAVILTIIEPAKSLR